MKSVDNFRKLQRRDILKFKFYKVAKIQEVFSLFDKDCDGDIPTQELGTALRALGTYPSQRELNDEFKHADEVEFETFKSLLAE